MKINPLDIFKENPYNVNKSLDEIMNAPEPDYLDMNKEFDLGVPPVIENPDLD